MVNTYLKRCSSLLLKKQPDAIVSTQQIGKDGNIGLFWVWEGMARLALLHWVGGIVSDATSLGSF